MRHNVIVRAVLFVGVASAALDPQDAEAFEQRVSAAICTKAPESNQAVYHDAEGLIRNSAGAAPGYVRCPLNDNSNHDFTDVDYVTVFVYDDGRRSPAAHTKAQACITPYGIDGIFCGNLITSPAYGYQELALDNYWNSPPVAGFGYVHVELAYWTGGAGGPSAVEGIIVGYP